MAAHVAPVDWSIDKPVGRAGETDHETTAPPLEVGVTAVMAEFFVSVKELGVVMEDGAMSLTVIVTVAVVLPPCCWP